MSNRTSMLVAIVATLVLTLGCGGGKGRDDVDADDVAGEEAWEPDVDEDVTDDDVDEEAPPDGPEGFDRWCLGEDWDADLVPAVVEEMSGEYQRGLDWPVGTMEIMKVIPRHPFHVTTVKAAFAGGLGTARIRLMESFGRSYPETASGEGDLMTPAEIPVDGPNPNTWVEIDVSDQDIFLLPTQHYILVHERTDMGPAVTQIALEALPEGELSRAQILVPGAPTNYGVDGNFRMKLEGEYFCTWGDGDWWFEESTGQPFDDDLSARAAITDLDGDGHDDLVTISGGPHLYLGDGAGGFTVPSWDPFPDSPDADMLVFGDLDNDGDRDAFAAWYVGVDSDGDGITKPEGDCDDTDDTVRPTAPERPGNLLDDDCDTVADDGTDTSDSDGDGHTIAAGDCDDTRDDVFPGNPEVKDGRDNDCDRDADEDFTNLILENDGTGTLTEVPASGVEVLDHSSSAALGDGDGDGVLDLYWGNWLHVYPYPDAEHDRYFTGNGDGTFTDAMVAAGLVPSRAEPCYGVTWTDYNNDGHQDIWVGNYNVSPNFLWHNEGDGTFRERAAELGIAEDDIGYYGGHSYGGAWADFDNDGDMDLYTPNLAHPRDQPSSDISKLYVNEGPPLFTFVDMRVEYGLIYDEGDVTAAWADWDHDMDLDLAVASLYTNHYFRLYRNDGDVFTDVTYETHTAVHDSVSAVWSDVDEDGDLDLVVADRDGDHRVHLFMNLVGQDAAWVQMKLQGTSTNTDAVGARVTLTAGGITQMRDVEGGGHHFNTQNSLVVHFGLADLTTIDEVTVRWVGGSTETITGITPGQRWLVVEGSGTGVAL